MKINILVQNRTGTVSQCWSYSSKQSFIWNAAYGEWANMFMPQGTIQSSSWGECRKYGVSWPQGHMKSLCPNWE